MWCVANEIKSCGVKNLSSTGAKWEQSNKLNQWKLMLL